MEPSHDSDSLLHLTYLVHLPRGGVRGSHVREHGAVFDIDDVDTPLVAPPPLAPLPPPTRDPRRTASSALLAPIPYDIEAEVDDANVEHHLECDGESGSKSKSKSDSESESDEGGVEMLESVPLVEMIARDIAAAEQRGDVIDLT